MPQKGIKLKMMTTSLALATVMLSLRPLAQK